MKLSNETYDILNKVQRWLTLLSALYVGIVSAWHLNWPTTEVEETIKYIVIFLAGILETSTYFYNKSQKQEMANDYDVSEPDENHG